MIFKNLALGVCHDKQYLPFVWKGQESGLLPDARGGDTKIEEFFSSVSQPCICMQNWGWGALPKHLTSYCIDGRGKYDLCLFILFAIKFIMNSKKLLHFFI